MEFLPLNPVLLHHLGAYLTFLNSTMVQTSASNVLTFQISFWSAEGADVDAVRENIDLIQTEWDVCGRELQATSDRVHTRTRIRQVSAQLADLDQILEKHDQWLSETSPVDSYGEVELRNLRGECKVGFITRQDLLYFPWWLSLLLTLISVSSGTYLFCQISICSLNVSKTVLP